MNGPARQGTVQRLLGGLSFSFHVVRSLPSWHSLVTSALDRPEVIPIIHDSRAGPTARWLPLVSGKSGPTLGRTDPVGARRAAPCWSAPRSRAVPWLNAHGLAAAGRLRSAIATCRRKKRNKQVAFGANAPRPLRCRGR
jgi:hypothetical protein